MFPTSIPAAAVRQRRIDPMVDFAFKILLGSEQNLDVLIFFLNSILRRSAETRIVAVTLLNPYNDKETAADKLTVVDVKARDASGHTFQIEVQLVAHRFLPERMVYTWSVLYGGQLNAGQHYEQLQPVTSIWLVRETVFPKLAAYHHRARFQDPLTGLVLDEQSAIHILEVAKWAEAGIVTDASDEWLRFLWEARNMDLETLSETLSPEFVRAVDALKHIREKEADYHKYQARISYLLEQKMIAEDIRLTREELEEAKQKLEQAQLQAEQAHQQAEQAQFQAEQAQLQAEQAHQQAEQAQLQAQQARQALDAERLEKVRLQELLRRAGISTE